MHRDDPSPSDPPDDDHQVADVPTKPVACGTHRSGHDPHHMQHRFCCRETDPDRVSRVVDVIDISDRGWITFELDGEVVRRWSHHVERLREAVAASDGTLVEVSLRWKLLKAYRPDLSGAWSSASPAVRHLAGRPAERHRSPNVVP